MELVEVLRHSESPRTEYFVEMPTAFGKLRLDLLGDVGVALAQGQMTPEMTATARGLIVEAESKGKAGDDQGRLDGLMEVVKEYPYSIDGYGALYNYYEGRGNRQETVYYLRQVIALDPEYSFITLLGKELGRAERYDEALVVQGYLWEQRHNASTAEAREAVDDYLVTLGRAGEAKKMIKVAGEALREMGNDSTVVYQYIYAHILDKQYAQARELLNKELVSLKGADPLYTRYIEMNNVLDDLLK